MAQTALSRDNEETLQAFLRAWREAQADYLEDPLAVQRFEAERIGQTPEEFSALAERMSATNPSFEEDLLTADFMGAPGEELDSRLMQHLQGIGAFLVAQERIDRTPDDWTVQHAPDPTLVGRRITALVGPARPPVTTIPAR